MFPLLPLVLFFFAVVFCSGLLVEVYVCNFRRSVAATLLALYDSLSLGCMISRVKGRAKWDGTGRDGDALEIVIRSNIAKASGVKPADRALLLKY